MATKTFGDYELHELLGRGGMGEVHRAYDTARKRTVALKRLPVSLAHDEAFRVRFRTESEVAARLTEPHVLPVHDYGEIDGGLYLDMRYVEGPDLGSLLARRGPLPPAEAVDVVGQVAAALDAAHTDGLVHRDVKPSNVLITLDDDRPAFAYLTDFGVAQIGGADTGLSTTNATAGTVDYMAPERYTSRRTDRLVDVYSLGCVLHEALTGDKPFAAESMPDAMHAHLNLDPPRASEENDAIPTALDDVVSRAMAKSPGDRYPTCGALAATARTALVPTAPPAMPQGGVVTAPAAPVGEPAASESLTEPVPPPAPRWRPARRVVVVAGAVAACALGAVALVPFASASSTIPAAPAPVVAPAPAPTHGWAATAAPAVASTVADGAFTGRTSGNEVTVALATKSGTVAAYLCDGSRVEAWLQGTVSCTKVHLTSAKGSVVDADLATDNALGTMTVHGQTLPFSARRSAPPAGLYKASSGSSKIGWIVLADGKQVGIRQDGATSSPAPGLDPTTLSTVVDGRAVSASRVEPGGASW